MTTRTLLFVLSFAVVLAWAHPARADQDRNIDAAEAELDRAIAAGKSGSKPHPEPAEPVVQDEPPAEADAPVPDVRVAAAATAAAEALLDAKDVETKARTPTRLVSVLDGAWCWNAGGVQGTSVISGSSVRITARAFLAATPAYSSDHDLPGEWDVEVPGWTTGGQKSAPRLSLDAPGDVDGSMRVAFKVACNSYGGRAKVQGSRIEFDVEAGTLIGCAPELVAKDRDFIRRLEAVGSFEISRVPEAPLTRVRLKDRGGATLVILRAGR